MIIYQSMIYRADLQANPNAIYVFGDNEQRYGLGGQAKEMRGEPNALGIATLKSPGVPWTDERFYNNRNFIDIGVTALKYHINAGDTIVFPMDGIGTGFARMKQSAPRSFNYLRNELAEIGIKNPFRE